MSFRAFYMMILWTNYLIALCPTAQRYLSYLNGLSLGGGLNDSNESLLEQDAC